MSCGVAYAKPARRVAFYCTFLPYLYSMERIHLVECPRDAIQGWHTAISTAEKVAYYRTLLDVGFDTLDLGSFVSPRAIPQMADTREVLDALVEEGFKSRPTRWLVIVANVRGARDAAEVAAVDDVGFPLSLSETFQQRNTGSGLNEAWERLAAIRDITGAAGKRLVVYTSMGFGNPYGDPYSPNLLVETAQRLVEELGVEVVSLSDTVGTASPTEIGAAFEALVPASPQTHFGAHLHANPFEWAEKAAAAHAAGCRRFDGAIRGVGGCPMAKDDLVGNLPTEGLVEHFVALGAWSVKDNRAWAQAQSIAADLFA